MQLSDTHVSWRRVCLNQIFFSSLRRAERGRREGDACLCFFAEWIPRFPVTANRLS